MDAEFSPITVLNDNIVFLISSQRGGRSEPNKDERHQKMGMVNHMTAQPY